MYNINCNYIYKYCNHYKHIKPNNNNLHFSYGVMTAENVNNLKSNQCSEYNIRSFI